jgi:Beta-xylosidase
MFDGNENHETIEGPKFYKRNGYYYIFAPAGGRIIHLQPMRWENDWPVMGENIDGEGVGEPILIYKKPNVGDTYPVEVPATSDEFNSEKLGLQWQWNANYKEDWYSLTAKAGYIRLNVAKSSANLCDVPSLLLQKFPAPEFKATMKMDFKGDAVGDSAGLVVLGGIYSSISLVRTAEGYELVQVKGENMVNESCECVIYRQKMSTPSLHLRVSVVSGAYCSFSYSEDGSNFFEFGEIFKTMKGAWVGAKNGCVLH